MTMTTTISAIAIQVGFGMLADVSWLITVNERWIHGAVPYRDFIEIDPPASIMLYWPAVRLALALGLRSELVVSTFGFACIGLCLALAGAILSRARLLAMVSPIALAFALIATAVMPGEGF